MTDRKQIEKAAKLIDEAKRILAKPAPSPGMIQKAQQKIDEAQAIQDTIKRRKDIVERARVLLGESGGV